MLALHPISNSLPDELFVDSVPEKTSAFAENIPGNKSTYIYHEEDAYLDHYRRAYYGVTRRKTGWDSGRHLEIMASGCVPFFIDMGLLPQQTLSFYPRGRIAAAMSLPGVRPVLYERDKREPLVMNAVPHNSRDRMWYLSPSSFSVAPSAFNASVRAAYFDLSAAILAHARRHLSASAVATHVLRTMGE